MNAPLTLTLAEGPAGHTLHVTREDDATLFVSVSLSLSDLRSLYRAVGQAIRAPGHECIRRQGNIPSH